MAQDFAWNHKAKGSLSPGSLFLSSPVSESLTKIKTTASVQTPDSGFIRRSISFNLQNDLPLQRQETEALRLSNVPKASEPQRASRGRMDLVC